MEKHRAPANRTITLSPEEIRLYASRCLRPEDGPFSPSAAEDQVILGALEDTAPLLPDAFVDLLIVDPPYNLSKTYGSRAFHQMDPQDYAAYTRRWLEAIRHTLKPNASVYLCCDWRSSMVIPLVLEEFFTIRSRITWQREKGRGARANWKNAMEDIWFATVSPKDYTFHLDAVKQRRRVLAPYRRGDGSPKDWQETDTGNWRDTCPSNFWDDISIPYWSMPENTDHPAQKPEKLFAKLILASSDPGAMVFDPFLGSGTAAVTARKLGRRFLGVEREEEYCALAQYRLELARTSPRIQGYSDGVFWERNSQPKIPSPRRKPEE